MFEQNLHQVILEREGAEAEASYSLLCGEEQTIYAQYLLHEQTQNKEQAMNLMPGSDEYSDLGAEILYVLYEEDEVIHSIMVRSGD